MLAHGAFNLHHVFHARLFHICNFLHPSTVSLGICIFSVQHARHTTFWHSKPLALAALGISYNRVQALKLGSKLQREMKSSIV